MKRAMPRGAVHIDAAACTDQEGADGFEFDDLTADSNGRRLCGISTQLFFVEIDRSSGDLDLFLNDELGKGLVNEQV